MIRKVFNFSACVGLLFVCSGLFGQTNAVKPAARVAQGEQALPSGVSADWWSTVKANIEKEEYNITWQDSTPLADVPSAYQAPNRAQGFQTYFTEEGIRVAPMRDDAPAWSWGLQFVGISRGDGVPSGSPAVRPSGASDNRIEFDRDGITEWYVNCEEGLEQGFTISRPLPADSSRQPADGGEGNSKLETRNSELSLFLRLTGTLHPRLAEDGQAVDFYDNGNIGVIHYAQLKVTDATGRVLPAHFEGWVGSARPVQSSEFGVQSGSGELSTLNSQLSTSAGGIRIVIDAAEAVYPITIDPLATSTAWTATGESTGNQFGYIVATAGDVNGDGYSDIIVGANVLGRCYLYLSGPSGLSSVPAWKFSSGLNSVATAGDVNGDGYSDVIIGNANGNTAYVFYGGPSGLPSTPSWSSSVGTGLGFSVASAGDVNGDGYADVIIGDAYNTSLGSDTGAAYVFLGGPSGLAATPAWSVVGEAAEDWFGYVVASAGDVNGDGYSDVLVSAAPKTVNAIYQSGKVYLYLGGPSGLSATPSWTNIGDNGRSFFYGMGLASAGDVNGDGYSDVLVGEKGYNTGGSTKPGKAFLYLGGPSGLSATPSWTYLGQASDSALGISLAAADINGDGYSDVIVGCPSGFTAGQAYLFLGGPTGIPATPSSTLVGENTGDGFGGCVASAGDVNGDGYSDVIIGAYYYGNSTGKAYVYLGGPSGLSATSSWSKAGESAGGDFGYTVAAAGDVNGDGYSDVVVGAYGYGSSTGRAYLFLGGASGLSTTASWTATGQNTGDQFGRAVATAGDVNGDGYADVLVGAAGYTTNKGKAYLYLGGPSGLSATASWTAMGEATGNYFSNSLATAGDVNGDGYSDVIVGAYGNSTNTGKAYLYLGGPSGLSSAASWTAAGEATGNQFGYSVATAGDVNGDGYSDVIVGAYGYTTNTGKAYLYLGGPSGPLTTAAWSAAGGATGDRFGWSVATAGDVNGDGYSDVIVGAPYYSGSTGKAYLYLGGSSGLSATASWTPVGEAASNYFGWSVASAGDVDGDGYSDVIVGANGYSTNTGKAYLYLGGVSGLSATASWTAVGEATNNLFGNSVSAAGDVNGDGFSDVIVGAPSNSSSTGKAYVYYGGGGGNIPLRPRQLRSDGSTPIAPLGGTTGSQFTLSLAGRTPFGRGKVKVEWQIAPLGYFYPTLTPFQSAASWSDPGSISSPVPLLIDAPFVWRMRTKYSFATMPFQGHGRWVTLAAKGPRETALRRLPGCNLPDEACWLYLVTKSSPDNYPILNWQDPNQSYQRTGWNIRRSSNPALPKSSWPLIGTNVVDMDQAAANYQYTDSTGASGTWYYEVTAYNSYCSAEGPF